MNKAQYVKKIIENEGLAPQKDQAVKMRMSHSLKELKARYRLTSKGRVYEKKLTYLRENIVDAIHDLNEVLMFEPPMPVNDHFSDKELNSMIKKDMNLVSPWDELKPETWALIKDLGCKVSKITDYDLKKIGRDRISESKREKREKLRRQRLIPRYGRASAVIEAVRDMMDEGFTMEQLVERSDDFFVEKFKNSHEKAKTKPYYFHRYLLFGLVDFGILKYDREKKIYTRGNVEGSKMQKYRI